MKTFVLTGAEAVLHLEAGAPRDSGNYLAWGYRARLQGHALQVSIPVGDDNPASFVEFFESLARDWQGWGQTRAYESLDGTLSVTASHDGASSVRFEVRLRADSRTGFDWSAAHRITVGIGQLRDVAAAARDFAS